MKEELGKLKEYIKIECDKNVSMKNLIKAPIVDKIYGNLINLDLTKIPKFSKLIKESKDKNLVESINVLRV